MAFFERHPAIEYLNVASNLIGVDQRWFLPELPHKLLPNLRHLRVSGKMHPLNQYLMVSIIGSLE
jgi:hypothetical protein